MKSRLASLLVLVGLTACDGLPVRQDSTAMATALEAISLNVALDPVADGCSATAWIMWVPCFGASPAQVASSVGAVVDVMHAASMLSAAKLFPGHGGATVSAEARL